MFTSAGASFPGDPIVQGSLKCVGKLEGVVTAHFLDFVCLFGGKLIEDQFERYHAKDKTLFVLMAVSSCCWKILSR